MRVKMAVYEPGKADPSRIDRASTIDEFAKILTDLNPGDDVHLFFIQEGANGYDIINLPVKHEEEEAKEILDTFSTEIALVQQDRDNSLLLYEALQMSVCTDKPTLFEDLYNAVVDLISIGEWLTDEQKAIIDENLIRIVRSHDRT